MKDAGILHGYIALYDPAREPYSGDIIVCILNGTILIKKYVIADNGLIMLESAHNGVSPIEVKEIDDKFTILGTYQGAYISP